MADKLDPTPRCKTCYTTLNGRNLRWTFRGKTFTYCTDRCRIAHMERCGSLDTIPDKILKFKVGDTVKIRPNKEIGEEVNGRGHGYFDYVDDEINALGTDRVVTISEVFVKPYQVGDYRVEEMPKRVFDEVCFEIYDPIESRFSILDL